MEVRLPWWYKPHSKCSSFFDILDGFGETRYRIPGRGSGQSAGASARQAASKLRPYRTLARQSSSSPRLWRLRPTAATERISGNAAAHADV
eukprot:2143995-Prymnesium_polylepis.1